MTSQSERSQRAGSAPSSAGTCASELLPAPPSRSRADPWHDVAITRLIHVNGPPGVGKSTVARRYADEHPLTLLLEIDGLRTALGGWNQHEDSKLLARALALVMAESHLRSGHDVVVPQFLGREDFIVSLEAVARRSGAQFVEILIDVTRSAAGQRFRLRREALLASGKPHPQADVNEDAVEAAIAEATERLTAIAHQRPTVARIADADSIEVTYARMLEAINVVSR